MKGPHSRPLVAVQGIQVCCNLRGVLVAAASAVIIKTRCGGQLNALGSDALRVAVTPRLESGFYIVRPSDLSRCRLCTGTHHVMFSIISDYFTAPWLFPRFLLYAHDIEQCVDTLSVHVSPRITPRADAQHTKRQAFCPATSYPRLDT